MDLMILITTFIIGFIFTSLMISHKSSQTSMEKLFAYTVIFATLFLSNVFATFICNGIIKYVRWVAGV